MNLQETIALIGALKQAGATHFKSADFEVTFGQKEFLSRNDNRQEVNQIHSEMVQQESQEETPINQENTKKIEDLIETLTMKDEQLVDRIFPAGAL